MQVASCNGKEERIGKSPNFKMCRGNRRSLSDYHLQICLNVNLSALNGPSRQSEVRYYLGTQICFVRPLDGFAPHVTMECCVKETISVSGFRCDGSGWTPEQLAVVPEESSKALCILLITPVLLEPGHALWSTVQLM